MAYWPYRATIDHRRDQNSEQGGDAHDARMTSSSALLRLGNVFPPARARSRVDAQSVSTLSLSGPSQWSFETPLWCGTSKHSD